MSDKHILDYCPTDSFIHRLNPTIKILNFLIIIFAFFLTRDTIMIYVGSLIFLLQLVLSNVPLKYYFKILLTFIWLIMIMVVFTIPFGIDINVIGITVIKVVVILLNFMLLIHTTSTEKLVISLLKIVNVFNIFFIKLNTLGIRLIQTLKIIPFFHQSFHEILTSRASRGKDYRYATIIGKGKTFISCFGKTLELTFQKIIALEKEIGQKIFDLKEKRIKIDMRRLSFYDFFTLAIHLLLIVYFVSRVR